MDYDKKFIECKTKEYAENLAPWASYFSEVEGGYYAFKYLDEYQRFINQK